MTQIDRILQLTLWINQTASPPRSNVLLPIGLVRLYPWNDSQAILWQIV